MERQNRQPESMWFWKYLAHLNNLPSVGLCHIASSWTCHNILKLSQIMAWNFPEIWIEHSAGDRTDWWLEITIREWEAEGFKYEDWWQTSRFYWSIIMCSVTEEPRPRKNQAEIRYLEAVQQLPNPSQLFRMRCAIFKSMLLDSIFHALTFKIYSPLFKNFLPFSSLCVYYYD